MDNLYILSISGISYFLHGKLSLKECQLITYFAKGVKQLPSESELRCCERFLQTIDINFNIKLYIISINYVFRIGN